MFEAKIIVCGMGLVINFEIEMIKRALEAEGIKVTVVNDHPFEPGQYETMLEQTRKELIKNRSVVLIAQHQPWGG